MKLTFVTIYRRAVISLGYLVHFYVNFALSNILYARYTCDDTHAIVVVCVISMPAADHADDGSPVTATVWVAERLIDLYFQWQ